MLAPCLARTEHIYSVLIVLAPCLALLSIKFKYLLIGKYKSTCVYPDEPLPEGDKVV